MRFIIHNVPIYAIHGSSRVKIPLDEDRHHAFKTGLVPRVDINLARPPPLQNLADIGLIANQGDKNCRSVVSCRCVAVLDHERNTTLLARFAKPFSVRLAIVHVVHVDQGTIYVIHWQLL